MLGNLGVSQLCRGQGHQLPGSQERHPPQIAINRKRTTPPSGNALDQSPRTCRRISSGKDAFPIGLKGRGIDIEGAPAGDLQPVILDREN